LLAASRFNNAEIETTRANRKHHDKVIAEGKANSHLLINSACTEKWQVTSIAIMQ